MTLIREDAVQWRGARGDAGEARGQVRAGVKAFVDRERLETRKNWPANDRHSSSSRARRPASTPRHVDSSPVYRISRSQTGSVNHQVADNHDNLRDTFMCKRQVHYTVILRKNQNSPFIALEQGTIILIALITLILVGFGFDNFGYDERNQSSKYEALKYKWFVFYFQRHIHSCIFVYNP